MTAIPFDDYTLHAEVHFVSDQLPTLFLIHELAENCRMWDPLITYWKNRFNIVTYDFFGHGKTTDSQVHRATFNRLVDEAVTVINSLGLKKIHIIGDDFGGLLAILIANACRSKVQSLSLISTPWFMPRGTFDPWYQLFSRLIHTDRKLLAKQIILMSTYPVTPSKSRYIRNTFNRITTQTFLDCINLCRQMNESRNYFFLNELKSLHLPTLLLVGEYEYDLQIKMQIAFSMLIAGSRLYIVPGAARHTVLDNPEVTASMIQQFIRQAESSPSETQSPEHEELLMNLRHMIQESLKQDEDRYTQHLDIRVMSGPFSVTWNGTSVTGKWHQRHADELLLVLAMHGGTASRRQIIRWLMPELSETRARNYLRVWIAHLNKIFRDHPDTSARHILMTTREAVMLNAQISCDLLEFVHKSTRLHQSDQSAERKAGQFITLAVHYKNESLLYLKSEWLSTYINQLEQTLSEIMAGLVRELIRHDEKQLVREVLEAGKRFEPYEGYIRDVLSHLDGA